MVERVDVAEVRLWGRTIGAVAWDADRDLATFEYAPEFLHSGVELAPLTMPLGPGLFRFPGLARDTFRGLPGLLADALPDRFGSALIDRWLARQGRDRTSFSPVEELCYCGTRAMGALEFRPALSGLERSQPLALEALLELAREVLDERGQLDARRTGSDDEQALNTILRVGTSAGGARAKAVLAWNRTTGEIRSGQVPAPEGFEYWLLKFDGIQMADRETDGGFGGPSGYGRIEYAYSRMARRAGLQMSPCHLWEEGGRAHFMTRRFDRGEDGAKLHMQSLCAMKHLDFNLAGAHGYEQALQVIQALRMPAHHVAEQFRRMAFNVVARNQDDHTKNIAFLMDRDGQWTLAPAFDVTYAYNPSGPWTARHQMSVNGKRDGFAREDLLAVGRGFRVRGAAAILEEVCEAVAAWPEVAAEAGVDPETAEAVGKTHRLELRG